MLVGSLLALLAFLLAVTMGMASDRFDARRANVLTEANDIGTTYLRAGYLPEPASSQIRELLREYVPLRIDGHRANDIQSDIDRSVEIQGQIWAIAEDVARTTDKGDLVGLFIESLNDTIDIHETRMTAGLYARVPETVLLLLIGGSALSLAMVGYSAGLTRRRSMLSAVVLILALGAVIMIVDRPGPAARGLHPGQPATAPRSPAADRAAVQLIGVRARTRHAGQPRAQTSSKTWTRPNPLRIHVPRRPEREATFDPHVPDDIRGRTCPGSATSQIRLARLTVAPNRSSLWSRARPDPDPDPKVAFGSGRPPGLEAVLDRRGGAGGRSPRPRTTP